MVKKTSRKKLSPIIKRLSFGIEWMNDFVDISSTRIQFSCNATIKFPWHSSFGGNSPFFLYPTVHHSFKHSFNFAQAYILMWWICLPRGLGHCVVSLLAFCPFVAISKLRRSMLITYFVVVWFLQLSTQCNGFLLDHCL